MLKGQQQANRGSHEMALSFRFATQSDIPALLKLRLAVDADQAERFGKNRWSTTINEKSVARGLKSSRVLLARRHGRIIGTLRMETKKPWAIDLRYFTPVAKAVYLPTSMWIRSCGDQVSDVSLSSARKLLRASGLSGRFASTRMTDRRVADRFTGSAGSLRLGARSIEVCRSSTSSSCSRVDHEPLRLNPHIRRSNVGCHGIRRDDGT